MKKNFSNVAFSHDDKIGQAHCSYCKGIRRNAETGEIVSENCLQYKVGMSTTKLNVDDYE